MHFSAFRRRSGGAHNQEGESEREGPWTRKSRVCQSPLIRRFLSQNLGTSKRGEVCGESASPSAQLGSGLFSWGHSFAPPSQVVDWDMPQGGCPFLSTCWDWVVVDGPLPGGRTVSRGEWADVLVTLCWGGWCQEQWLHSGSLPFCPVHINFTSLDILCSQEVTFVSQL